MNCHPDRPFDMVEATMPGFFADGMTDDEKELWLQAYVSFRQFHIPTHAAVTLH